MVSAEHKLAGKIDDPNELYELRKAKMPELFKFPYLPRTKTVRQAGKGCNFQLDYREGYRAYALINEMDEREAKRQVHAYRNVAYPGLLTWYDSIDKEIRDSRTLTNCFGRRIYYQGAMDDAMFREATNFKSQSTVFDVTSHAIPLIMEDESSDFAVSEIMTQVHDSLLVQHRSRDFPAMARFAIKLAFDYMSPTLNYNGMDFTLGVGMKAGLDWAHMTELRLTRDADALARDLDRVWHESQEARLKAA